MKKIFLFAAAVMLLTACHKPEQHAYDTDGLKGTVVDHEGNTYQTVHIGSQEWMAENMRCKTTLDNTMAFRDSSLHYLSLTEPIAYQYKNNPENATNRYGYLYNWTAANNICPDGWRLPTQDDFDTLEQYLGGLDQYRLEENPYQIAKALADSIGWDHSRQTNVPGNQPELNNSTGFSALPAGYYDGIFEGRGHETTFWTSTDMPASMEYAYSRTISFMKPSVNYNRGHKNTGLSVRCVKE